MYDLKIENVEDIMFIGVEIGDHDDDDRYQLVKINSNEYNLVSVIGCSQHKYGDLASYGNNKTFKSKKDFIINSNSNTRFFYTLDRIDFFKWIGENIYNEYCNVSWGKNEGSYWELKKRVLWEFNIDGVNNE
jgi:hypothetical protein